MVELTAFESRNRCTGVIGTEGFVRHVKFESDNAVYPDNQQQQYVSAVIYDCIKGGGTNPSVVSGFKDVLDTMTVRGVDVFALCCTELSIAFERFGFDYPHIDSSELLAKEIIIRAGGRLKGLVNISD
jgi:aspartate/glutamate racemase